MGRRSSLTYIITETEHFSPRLESQFFVRRILYLRTARTNERTKFCKAEQRSDENSNQIWTDESEFKFYPFVILLRNKMEMI